MTVALRDEIDEIVDWQMGLRASRDDLFVGSIFCVKDDYILADIMRDGARFDGSWGWVDSHNEWTVNVEMYTDPPDYW